MEKKNDTQMTPFKVQVLTDIAAKVVKLMVSGSWNLTFDEMDIVLEIIRIGIDESRRKNREGQNRCS